MTSGPEEAFEERFEEMSDRAWQLRQEGRFQSAARLIREARREAKAASRIVPYLRACHGLMVFAGGLHQMELCRDVALETIALLESEDRARAFEPDFPDDWYEMTVAWMSACAYDNLAKSVAGMCGYNSAGTHECITEGLQICRQTGKLECISCFREYAVDVYQAADDLDMALHYARSGARQAPVEDDNDRRWAAAKDEARVLLMLGQIDAAIEAYYRALDLAQSFHASFTARVETLQLLQEALLLAGKTDDAENVRHELAELPDIPAGEWPEYELTEAYLASLRAIGIGELEEASRILAEWDRRLSDEGFLSEWFETRLRLIALTRINGDDKRAQRLAEPLRQKAEIARDWLSLRRLKRLWEDTPVSPLALAGAAQVSVPEASPSQPDSDEAEPEEETPLHGALHELRDEAVEHSQDPAELLTVFDRILSYDPASVADARDGRRLLMLANQIFWRVAFVETDEMDELDEQARAVAHDRAAQIWNWASDLVQRFPAEAQVLNLAADLGDSIQQHAHLGVSDVVSGERVAEWFRQSLDLDPTDVANYARAGGYYWSEGNVGEAERAFARGFRLDRTDPYLALRLADVYSQTDRTRDGLEVLDMCLREGVESPQLLWEAGLAAFRVDAFESMLTYLERFESSQPGERWTHYYLAIGKLETNQPDAAIECIAREEQHAASETFHLDVLRASAAALRRDGETLRHHLRAALDTPLSQIDYLTESGIIQLHARLWSGAAELPDDDPLFVELQNRMLAITAMPDEFFDGQRRERPVEENLQFHRVILRQPVDDQWRQSPARFAVQHDWPSYLTAWGVLANSEERAVAEALRWQGRCADLPAEVIEVETDDGLYADSPGVVWQGAMESEEEEE